MELKLLNERLKKIEAADMEILSEIANSTPDPKAAAVAIEAEMAATEIFNHNIFVAITDGEAAIVVLSSRPPAPETLQPVPPQTRSRRIDVSGITALDDSTTLRDFKTWRAQWNGIYRYENMDNLPIFDQRTILNRVLTLNMQKTINQILGISPDDENNIDEILDLIEQHLRKKQNIAVDIRDFTFALRTPQTQRISASTAIPTATSS